jgi:hypothetical protein
MVIGYRYLGGPTADLPVRVSTILNADQVTNAETTSNIAARLAPAPARVAVTGSRLLIGLKVRPQAAALKQWTFEPGRRESGAVLRSERTRHGFNG